MHVQRPRSLRWILWRAPRVGTGQVAEQSTGQVAEQPKGQVAEQPTGQVEERVALKSTDITAKSGTTVKCNIVP